MMKCSVVLFAALVALSLHAETAEVWGEEVQGVKVKLTANKQTWGAGVAPEFSVDVSNTGTKEWFVWQTQEVWSLELDGVHCSWTGSIDAKSSSLTPGRLYEKIRVGLDPDWKAKGTQALKLTPGKHTLRVIVYIMPPIPTKESSKIKVPTNEVTFEITEK